MAEIRYDVSMFDGTRASVAELVQAVNRVSAAVRDAAEVNGFAKRVRLPLFGRVAALYSRFETWRAARVERQAQVCFERGWA